MDRINSDNIGYDAQGRRIFKDGPPATTLPAQWCTGIQEEMMAVIESEGFAGSVSDNTLMLKAITAAIARATDNYVTVHDLGTKNILSQYSSFNLDLYISGGLLAKPSGWKCRIAVSNGNGSYYCDLSTTYNINGISALNFRMYGTGNYVFELENQTGNWNVIQDNAERIRAAYINVTTSVGLTAADFGTRVVDNYACVTTGANWKFISKRLKTYLITAGAIAGGANDYMILFKNSVSIHHGTYQTAFGGQFVGTWAVALGIGESVDIRASNGVKNGIGHIMIEEI